MASAIPTDLAERLRVAQQSGDWKALAESLAATYKGVADGTVKATAAQASVLNKIYDRAYGRVSKAQEDVRGPIGVVVLPTLGDGSTLQICPKCLLAHQSHD